MPFERVQRLLIASAECTNYTWRYNVHVLSVMLISSNFLNLRNMKKKNAWKRNSQRGSKTWHWLGLARLCSDRLRKNERKSAALCHHHSNDMQDLSWKWKFILVAWLVVVVFKALTLFDVFFFAGSICLIPAIKPRHRTPHCCKARGKRSNLCIVKEKGHGKGYVLWYRWLDLLSWCINTVTFRCYERFNTYD